MGLALAVLWIVVSTLWGIAQDQGASREREKHALSSAMKDNKIRLTEGNWRQIQKESGSRIKKLEEQLAEVTQERNELLERVGELEAILDEEQRLIKGPGHSLNFEMRKIEVKKVPVSKSLFFWRKR